MKILAKSLGKEYVRISKNDNGYIQDFLIEVIVQKNETDLKNELQQKKNELQQKKNELQQKKNELQQKKNELQPLFVGVIDDISIIEMYNYLNAGVITKSLYTNRHYNHSGWNCFCEYWTWNANFSFAFIGTAGKVANIQSTLLRKIKDAKGSVTNFRYHPNCYGLTTWNWRVDDGFRSVFKYRGKIFKRKERVESRRQSVYIVKDNYVRYIANLFFDYSQYQEYFIKITSAYSLIQNIRAIEGETGLINSINSELNTQIQNIKDLEQEENQI